MLVPNGVRYREVPLCSLLSTISHSMTVQCILTKDALYFTESVEGSRGPLQKVFVDNM